jgi:uncharacterized protein
MSALRRHPLITFFVLTYALTWWAVPSGGFIPAGPLLAAVIVIPLIQGLAGLRDLDSRMIRWSVGWIWYVVAIGLPLAVLLVSVALSALPPSPPTLPTGAFCIQGNKDVRTTLLPRTSLTS